MIFQKHIKIPNYSGHVVQTFIHSMSFMIEVTPLRLGDLGLKPNKRGEDYICLLHVPQTVHSEDVCVG